MKKIGVMIGLIIIALAATHVSAARVGVLVNFPDGTVKTACVEPADNENGYDVMQKTGFSLLWAGPSIYGHSLCRIDGVGDDVSGDYCFWSGKYWRFFIADQGAWSYMPVGWDAGESCWSGDPNSYDGHYCAKDGDLLGYLYGEFDLNVFPAYKSFSDICPPKRKTANEREAVFKWGGIREEADGNLRATANEAIELTLTDEKTGKVVKHVTIEVRDERLQKIMTAEADDKGNVLLLLDKPGKYRLLIIASDYPHKQASLTVEPQETTSSSSSTTTIIQSTTSTSTTTNLPHFLSPGKEQAATTTVEQTTTTQPATTSSVLEVPSKVAVTGGIVQSSGGNRTRNTAILVIAVLAAGVLVLSGKK